MHADERSRKYGRSLYEKLKKKIIKRVGRLCRDVRNLEKHSIMSKSVKKQKRGAMDVRTGRLSIAFLFFDRMLTIF